MSLMSLFNNKEKINIEKIDKMYYTFFTIIIKEGLV